MSGNRRVTAGDRVSRTVVVVTGGPAPDPSIAAFLPDTDQVVVADSGLDHARALGLVPTLLVGDLDSISPEGLRWAREHGIATDEHPADKDATDLDLALSAAAPGNDRIVVVDAGAGRLDHSVANLLLLASDRFARLVVSAYTGDALVTVVRGEQVLAGRPGSVVSLLAVGGPATGVTTSGLRWALADATLEPCSTLGVSNELVDARATVTVAAGVVLAIQPERAPLA